MELPKPRDKGEMSVEESIAKRRSVRAFGPEELPDGDISQLLWSCQGITDEPNGYRAVPSAGALYPLEIYIAKKDGVFHYIPGRHYLEKVTGEDVRGELGKAAYSQEYVAHAPVSIIIAAIYERVTSRYGERGVRYTDMEAGHAAQNISLQAVALGLDSVPVGAFSDGAVSKILGLPNGTKPLYILPIGRKKR